MKDWREIAKHDEKNIKGFFGAYRWLSNFHLCQIQFDGLVYPATENAYMAAKSVTQPQYRKDLQGIAPNQAKKLGKTCELCKDWEEVKLKIMYDLNLQKFQNDPHLRACLLATGSAYLEETNYWGDTYWGVCEGVGRNELGKILMGVRQDIV